MFGAPQHAAPAFSAPAPGRGSAVYAIGDIHGRCDLLIELFQKIEDDVEALDRDPPLIVFMGDYIDRGDDSREVLDCLTMVESEGACDMVFLLGNHEKMLLDFLAAPYDARQWLRFGGLNTLFSYGVRGVSGTDTSRPELLREMRDRLAEAIEPAHLDFLRRLVPVHRTGNVLFCHAGADPELPPDAQDRTTLLWGCRQFRKVPRSDGIWVVHGHTIVDRAVADQGVISVDTGAYLTGRLSAARILDGAVTFLST